MSQKYKYLVVINVFEFFIFLLIECTKFKRMCLFLGCL